MASPTPPTFTFTLTAAYTTATKTSDPFTITSNITSTTPVETPVEKKTLYLKSLRDAVRSAQEEINKELTLRMEEDNARASAAAANDAKEEENYGEEMPEED
ncbi:EKC/KEOPS complex, subunit Gon7 [Podospora conica]|nr:EKC/KEOPS complex, subunit Gon7 [Schizothecium conicum]